MLERDGRLADDIDLEEQIEPWRSYPYANGRLALISMLEIAV